LGLLTWTSLKSTVFSHNYKVWTNQSHNTTSQPRWTYIGPPLEFILYSSTTTSKSSFLSLPLPTSTTCYLPQHNQSTTKLHTCSMLQAYHTTHAPVLKVMGFGRHKVFQGFGSALFGIHRSTSLFVICSISLPYTFQDNSLYVYVLFLYRYSSCSMHFTCSNINLASLSSYLALVCLKLLC